MLNPIDYWKGHEELTVIQAVLLVIDQDPSELQQWVFSDTNRPTGFDAIYSGVTIAINSKKLKATVRYRVSRQADDPKWVQNNPPNWVQNNPPNWVQGASDDEYKHEFSRWSEGKEIETIQLIYKQSPDWFLTTVCVDDLKKWLSARNFYPSFFFNETNNTPNYLDETHPRYSPKLAATVKAWLAMEDGNLLEGKATKSAIADWLESRYKELGLVYDGKLNKSGIEECTKVANWNEKGGATKTPER